MPSLKYSVACYHLPTSILFGAGVYNKANIPCHFLSDSKIIHPRSGTLVQVVEYYLPRVNIS